MSIIEHYVISISKVAESETVPLGNGESENEVFGRTRLGPFRLSGERGQRSQPSEFTELFANWI